MPDRGQTTQYMIIIETSYKNNANNYAAIWDTDSGGINTFDEGILSSDGSLPATHNSCVSWLTSTMKNLIDTGIATESWAQVYDVTDGSQKPKDILNNIGLISILQEEEPI
jgi:hypothetical protein